jgi:ribonuclease D
MPTGAQRLRCLRLRSPIRQVRIISAYSPEASRRAILKTETIEKQKPLLFETDLPDDIYKKYSTRSVIAIDTETRGLNIPRDRLCLIQLCDEDGLVAFVRFTGKPAPNLKKLLESPEVVKLFHFGRFDIAVLKHWMGIDIRPVWCTKIASKLVRTYTDRHSLKDLVVELLGIELDKSNQSSDWARDDLSDSQLEYAANDVRVLIPLQRRFVQLLERENFFRPFANSICAVGTSIFIRTEERTP